MSKHTPGPWEAHDEGCNCLFIRGQVQVNEGATSRERQYYSSIATVTQRDPHPRLGGGINRSVTAANARLIAAAPTMRAFIEKRVIAGDLEAAELLEQIDACR